MNNKILELLQKHFHPEHPNKIQVFRETLGELRWDKTNSIESFSTLFQAVDCLAEAEVRYYYRRRGTRAWISGVARFSGWLFGSIGLLLPLLAATTNPEFKEMSQFGYVFLAASGSCLSANALFGGTEGHIRFMSTQLELEKLITQARIKWCSYISSVSLEDSSSNEEGFKLIMAYANDLHTITITETGRWGEAVQKELDTFQRKVDSKKTTPVK